HLHHGNNEETINFNNFRAAIEQWTNVLGLAAMPTRTHSRYEGAAATSARPSRAADRAYTASEAWEALNKQHSLRDESVAILARSGPAAIRGQDPWDAARGDMGEPGVGGAAGSGGAAAAGTGGASAPGGAGGAAGTPGAPGGAPGTG